MIKLSLFIICFSLLFFCSAQNNIEDSLEYYINEYKYSDASKIISENWNDIKKSNDKELIVKAAKILRKDNDRIGATELLHIALETSGSDSSQIIANQELAIIARTSEDVKSAEAKLNSIKSVKLKNFPILEANNESIRGNLQYGLYKTNEALMHYKNAMNIYESLNDSSGIGLSFNNFANIDIVNNNYTSAESNMRKALDYSIDEDRRTKYRITLANVLIRNQKWGEALKQLNLAQQDAYQLNLYREYPRVSKNKAILYEEVNNVPQLIYHLKRAQKLTDSVFHTQNEISIQNLNSRYESRKKDGQIIKLRTNFALAGSLLLLTLVALTYFRQRHKFRRQALEDEIVRKEQDAEIEAINALLDGREEERQRIARTLHDSVSAMLSSTNLHLETYKLDNHINDITLEKAQGMIDHISDNVRTLSHELMNNILIKYGLEEACRDLSEKLSNSQLQFVLTSEIEKLRFEPLLEQSVFNIIQELCNNAIKHSGANKATINLASQNNSLIVEVIDNGKGFDPENIKRDTMGLNQIKSRVNGLGGKINITSSPEKGSKIFFEISITS